MLRLTILLPFGVPKFTIIIIESYAHLPRSTYIMQPINIKTGRKIIG